MPSSNNPKPDFPQPDLPQESYSTAPSGTRRSLSLSRLAIRGQGVIILQLYGHGCLIVRRGRGDEFSFDGRGLPRHTSARCIRMSNAEGRVVLRGTDLEVEFSGGRADVAARGTFEVIPGKRNADGPGSGDPLAPPARVGARRPGAHRGRGPYWVGSKADCPA